jgi:hypothetical protein
VLIQWLIDWCLMPALAVFQPYCGMSIQWWATFFTYDVTMCVVFRF